MEYISEISIIIKGDDRLALEALQDEVMEKAHVLADNQGFTIEQVAQPIRENDPEKERAVYIGRGLCTQEEAERIWGMA